MKNLNKKIFLRIFIVVVMIILYFIIVKILSPKIQIETPNTVIKTNDNVLEENNIIEIIEEEPVLEEKIPIIEEEKDEIEVTPIITDNDKEIYYILTDEERHIVECLVAGEARGECFEGQMAVAQCILNATIRSNISISEVKSAYGYVGWYDFPENYPSVAKAVSAVFDNGEVVTNEFIIWFYNPNAGYSSWHETQKFVIEIGGHRFFAPWN